MTVAAGVYGTYMSATKGGEQKLNEFGNPEGWQNVENNSVFETPDTDDESKDYAPTISYINEADDGELREFDWNYKMYKDEIPLHLEKMAQLKSQNNKDAMGNENIERADFNSLGHGYDEETHGFW